MPIWGYDENAYSSAFWLNNTRSYIGKIMTSGERAQTKKGLYVTRREPVTINPVGRSASKTRNQLFQRVYLQDLL